MASEKVLKIGNVLAFIFFAATTGYSLFSKDHIAEIFQGYQTYFDPARWVFIVWPIIHLLLLGFIAYQWTDDAHESAVNGVGWLFGISAALNSLWFSLLEGNHPIIAFIVSVLLVMSVSVIYYNLAEHHDSRTWGQIILVHAPFSLWHGFTVFMAVLNAFVAFTTVARDDKGATLPPDAFHLGLVWIAFVFLALCAVGYAQYKHEQCDVTSAWVVAFGLWAVFGRQRDPNVHWPALAAALVATLWPIKPIVFKLMRNRVASEQLEPLLQE